jgi:hypothetical protein
MPLKLHPWPHVITFAICVFDFDMLLHPSRPPTGSETKEMSSSSGHADSTLGSIGDDAHSGGTTADYLRLLKQRLETLELQATLDAQNITQLQERNKELEDALDSERAHGEKHADALMRIARTCDNSFDEMKAQHAAAIVAKENTIAKLEQEQAALRTTHAVTVAKLEAEMAALKASTAATFAKLEEERADLKAQVAMLQAQTTSNLTDMHSAIYALHTLLPPPLPLLLLPSMIFDRDWCAAACGGQWKVDIDAATGTRAHVTQPGQLCLTLRSAAPLPRRPAALPHAAAADGPHSRHRQQQLPAYRVIVEAYSRTHGCLLGFVPSHYVRADAGADDAAAAITAAVGNDIWNYGGWFIDVRAASPGAVTGAKYTGWVVLEPSRGAAIDPAGNTSAFATTSKVPPVPPDSAVEFSVDYIAGTCRVAFYTPAAVAGGFVEAPHAKMELRFVATEADEDYEWSKIPARPVPTRADSGVALYPAVETSRAGAIVRFAPSATARTP